LGRGSVTRPTKRKRKEKKKNKRTKKLWAEKSQKKEQDGGKFGTLANAAHPLEVIKNTGKENPVMHVDEKKQKNKRSKPRGRVSTAQTNVLQARM